MVTTIQSVLMDDWGVKTETKNGSKDVSIVVISAVML